MAILKTQRNALMALILKAGMAPTEFRLEPGDTNRVTYVGPGTEPDEFTFVVTHDLSFACHPFRLGGFQFLTPSGDRWGTITNEFSHWLKGVEAEIKAPDLWADVADVRKAIENAAKHVGTYADTPFVETELKS